MGEDKIVFVLLGVLFTALTSINAEKLECPCECHCSTDYTAVKCRGLEKFPALKFAGDVRSLDLSQGHITDINKTELKAYDSLQHLDIRNNGIKSVSPGLFSEMKSLRELFIDNNPWSCDESTLHVMQMELIALADKKLHLENFDGGKIECFDPPDMKGKKPLHSINPMTKVYQVQKSRQADRHKITCGIISVSIFLVMLLFVICGTVYMFRGKLLVCINVHRDRLTSSWTTELERKSKPATDPASKMEAGELGNKSSLADSKKKRRRRSHGTTRDVPRDISTVDEGPGVGAVKKDEKYNIILGDLINRMEKRRRMSQGLPASAKSSSCSVDVDGGVVDLADKSDSNVERDSKNIFMDGIEKRRRMSQGLPASARSSTSSLDEVNGGEVDLADKLKSYDKLDGNNNFMDSMNKTGEPLVPDEVRSSCKSNALDEAVAHSAMKFESQGPLHEEGTLNNSMMESDHVSQDVPVSNTGYASNSDDDIFHLANKSGSYAEEDDRSDEEGYTTPS